MKYLIGILILTLIITIFVIHSYNKPKDMTVQEAISELGILEGTLYLSPGTWTPNDKCVYKITINKEVKK